MHSLNITLLPNPKVLLPFSQHSKTWQKYHGKLNFNFNLKALT